MPEVSGMQDWHIDPEEETLNRMMIERKAGRSWADRVLKGRGSISVAELLHKEPIPSRLASTLFFYSRSRRPFVTRHLLVENDKIGMYVLYQGLAQRIFWAKYGLDKPFRARDFKFPNAHRSAMREGCWQDLEHGKAPKLRDYLLARRGV